MKIFSTFSGIGGFEIGIQNAYTEISRLANPQEAKSLQDNSPNDTSADGRQSPTCVGYSEIDRYAIKVYEKQFGGECENCRLARERERDSSTSRGQETLNSERTRLPQTVRNNDNTQNERSESDRTTCEHTPRNFGDITKINADELPDFDCLVGGFPCQAFSIAGKRAGFEDTRGTLFFDLARILRAKQPRLFVFENVKGLLSHDSGRTFKTIIETIDELGYDCQWQVLNSKNHGVPQNRERVYIVGHLRGECSGQVFPIIGADGKDIIVSGVLDTETWRKRHEQIRRFHSVDGVSPTLPTGTGGGVMTKIAVHKKDGNIEQTEDVSHALDSSYHKGLDNHGQRTGVAMPVLTPDRINKRQNGRRMKEDGEPSFTITAQDRHGLYDGIKVRRLTPLECERLQGFPDNWTAEGVDGAISDTQRYKMCGNAVTTNVVQAVFERILR